MRAESDGKRTGRAEIVEDFVGANLRIDGFDGGGHGDELVEKTGARV